MSIKIAAIFTVDKCNTKCTKQKQQSRGVLKTFYFEIFRAFEGKVSVAELINFMSLPLS